MDDIDNAQQIDTRLFRIALANHGNRCANNENVTDECIDCGEKISLARRKAMPGCERCVFCQGEYERKSK